MEGLANAPVDRAEVGGRLKRKRNGRNPISASSESNKTPSRIRINERQTVGMEPEAVSTFRHEQDMPIRPSG